MYSAIDQPVIALGPERTAKGLSSAGARKDGTGYVKGDLVKEAVGAAEYASEGLAWTCCSPGSETAKA